MAKVEVRTIHGVNYTVDEKSLMLETACAESFPTGYVVSVSRRQGPITRHENVFIPFSNIDRIIWDT